MNTVIRAIIFVIILAAIVTGIIYIYTPLPEKAAAPAPAATTALPRRTRAFRCDGPGRACSGGNRTGGTRA